MHWLSGAWSNRAAHLPSSALPGGLPRDYGAVWRPLGDRRLVIGPTVSAWFFLEPMILLSRHKKLSSRGAGRWRSATPARSADNTHLWSQ